MVQIKVPKKIKKQLILLNILIKLLINYLKKSTIK